MPNYSINELESLVQKGKFKKKVVKSTYAGEYLSRFYDCVKGGILTGSIFGGGTGAISLSFVGEKRLFSDEIFTYADAGAPALMAFLLFGVFGGFLGSMPTFYNWKERAKPYVDAGGKIIYEEKGLKFKRKCFTLPINYKINPNEKINWNLPFAISSPDLDIMFNP